ncbi:MAG TPA: hypothetical protein VGR45_06910 [Stellaceae bacterium]|nr:hypothetical protein [Stellaceae bacterium]
MNSDAASEYPGSEKSHSHWAAGSLVEASAHEAIPRVSRLTALVVMAAASLGIWAAIWAVVTSLCGG